MCPSVPGRVVSVEGTVATIEVDGERRTADARLTPVKPGDFVLVYGGLIIRTLDEKEAKERLETLRKLGEGPSCFAPP